MNNVATPANESADAPAPRAPRDHIFLSYASEDDGKARRLSEYLRGCGWQVWSDREIPIGRAYDEAIEAALRQAICVVVLWSRASVSSRWVRSEASDGAAREILVPVMIEDTSIPLEFRLLQTVDLRSWDGSSSDALLASVDEAIRRITNAGVSAEPDVDPARVRGGPGPRSRALPVVQMGAALLLLLGLSAGAWWWDAYYRDHTEYFANVTRRWGFPEGIGPLSAAQVAARNVSIAILRKGRRNPPYEIRLVNASGNIPPFGYHFTPVSVFDLNPLPRGGIEDPMSAEVTQLVRVLFSRNAEGRIFQQTGLSRSGRHLYTIGFNEPGIGLYHRGGFGVAVRHSGIKYLRISHVNSGPHAGLDERVEYLDEQRRAQSDTDGSFGYRIVLNPAGLATEHINLGADGKDAANAVGIFKQTRSYDALGNAIRVVTLNQKGLPTPTRLGDASLQLDYDDAGNIRRATYFDAQGQPIVLSSTRFAGFERTHDAHGNLTSLSLFGADRKPIVGLTGSAKITIDWQGANRSLTRFYGTNGKPAPVNRIFERLQTWNQVGLVIEETFRDETGAITRSDLGCATFRYDYDDAGNISKLQCLDEHGDATTTVNGFSTLQLTHDDAGNLLLTTAYDPRGTPGILNNAHTSVQRTYNAFGKIERETFLDAHGKPINSRSGCATITFDYDANGNEVASVCRDAADKRAMHVEGYSAIRKKYDERRLEVERAFFDTHDKPATTFEGWSTIRYEYDQRGFLIRQASLTASGRPLKTVDGFASARVKRNAAGQRLEVAYFDELGRPIIISRFGAAILRWAYDDAGRVAERSGHDGEGRLIRNPHGYSIIRYSYDEHSREVGRSVFDINGQRLDYKLAVDRVLPGSFAGEVGLRPGDVILTYDGEIVTTSHQFTDALELFRGDRRRELRIARGTQILSLDLKPGRLTGLELVEHVPGSESPRR